MAAPTLVDYQPSTWSSRATGNEVTPTVTWQSGDLILVVGATEDSGVTLNVPTATGLTFAQIATAAGASNAVVYAWTATAGSSGSGAITCAPLVDTGSKARGIAAFVYRGHGGTGATATITGSSAKVISLTRTAANSAVVTIMADWNAVNDTAVTASPSSGGTQRIAQFVTSAATFFVFSWADEGAVGTTSYGIASHTGTVDMNGIAIEIKGTASDITGTAAVTVANITAAGSGSLLNDGSAAVTSSAATATASGSLLNAGSGAVTVGSITAASSGSLAITGAAAVVGVAAIVDASGSLLNSGSSAAVAGDSTASASGSLLNVGSAAAVAVPVTASAAGSLALSGAAGVAVASVTAAASGALLNEGSASVSVDGISASAAASLKNVGAAAIVVGDITAVASGMVGSAIIGSAAIAAQDAVVAASGSLLNTGSGAAGAGPVTAAASGALLNMGVGAAVSSPATVLSSGTIGSSITGSASITVGAVTASASGSLLNVGSSASMSAAAVASGSGSLQLVGVGNAYSDSATVSAVGSVGNGAIPSVDGAVVLAAPRRVLSLLKLKRSSQFLSNRQTSFVTRGNRSMALYTSMQVGESIKYGIQFLEVPSVASANVSGSGIGISGQASAGNIVSAVLTPSTAGKFSVRYQATAPDAQVFVEDLIVTVA